LPRSVLPSSWGATPAGTRTIALEPDPTRTVDSRLTVGPSKPSNQSPRNGMTLMRRAQISSSTPLSRSLATVEVMADIPSGLMPGVTGGSAGPLPPDRRSYRNKQHHAALDTTRRSAGANASLGPTGGRLIATLSASLGTPPMRIPARAPAL